LKTLSLKTIPWAHIMWKFQRKKIHSQRSIFQPSKGFQSWYMWNFLPCKCKYVIFNGTPLYNKVYFTIYKLLDSTKIRRTLGDLCAFKYEQNFEFWIAFDSHWSLHWHHYKYTYVIENRTKSLMFFIHYVVSNVANICENYNLYSMPVHIRNEPSQLL